MHFVLGNLPDDVNKRDIKSLTGRYVPSQIKFFKNKHVKHSHFECMVSLDISNPVAGNRLEKQLNNFYLKGSRISVHRLLF